jgi:hypothetical protein
MLSAMSMAACIGSARREHPIYWYGAPPPAGFPETVRSVAEDRASFEKLRSAEQIVRGVFRVTRPPHILLRGAAVCFAQGGPFGDNVFSLATTATILEV